MWCAATYEVAGAEDPVEMQVFVGSNKALGGSSRATVERLSWQGQEVLQSIPSETGDQLRSIFLNPIIKTKQKSKSDS